MTRATVKVEFENGSDEGEAHAFAALCLSVLRFTRENGFPDDYGAEAIAVLAERFPAPWPEQSATKA